MLYLRDRRDLIIRLVELIIIGLVEFAIEAAKSADWIRFAVLCVLSLVALGVITLIQWLPRPPQKTLTQEKA
jgi:hypothetical protein